MTLILDIDNLLYNYKAYSNKSIYVKDNIVIKDSKYYRCIIDITEPEEWNLTHWEEESEIKLALNNMLIQNSISELRGVPEYVAMCKAHADGLLSIQNGLDYLLNYAINVYKAKGIWLDYIGWLVGIKRIVGLTNKFFCVNAEDVNKEKYFWFANSSIEEGESLDDEIYRKRIFGKILYNKSKCTRNENIAIIKYMTNAEHCIITKVAPMLFDMTLYGDDIITSLTLRDEVESFLGEGRGIRNFETRSLSDYEQTYNS